jgi:hypothetical protein
MREEFSEFKLDIQELLNNWENLKFFLHSVNKTEYK